MGQWLPRWLGEVYSKLLLSFGSSRFTVEQAREIGVRKPEVTLPRLAKSGWIVRISRGSYTLSPPVIPIISSFQRDWREMVKQKEYIPLLEFLVARLLEGYGKKLKGLVLFGSVARGTARQESDVDVLVIAEDMPERYGDRVRKTLAILSSLETLKRELYANTKLRPNLDLILLDEEETQTPHPFLLDVVKEGIMLFDRNGFTQGALDRLKAEFQRMGAVRVERPEGRWHWVLPRGEEDMTMDMTRLAADYLRRARARLIDGDSPLKRGDHPEVVRYSQEAVELSLKACLRMVGVEYPKVHDVGDELKLNSPRFPTWFSRRIEEFAKISTELAMKRAASMYGIEAAGKGRVNSSMKKKRSSA
jgi:HEPN domain-containing protein/predicted nucleotidyltransferase